MDYAEFQEWFEEEAGNNFARFLSMSEEHLLYLIQKHHPDDTYQIWRALGEKGTQKSIPVLFKIVSNIRFSHLDRYHACDALFKIAHINNDDLKHRIQSGRDLNNNMINQLNAIEQLKKILAILE